MHAPVSGGERSAALSAGRCAGTLCAGWPNVVGRGGTVPRDRVDQSAGRIAGVRHMAARRL